MRAQKYFVPLLLGLLTISFSVVPGQTAKKGKQPAAPAATPTPFPVIESIQPAEVARGRSVTFRGQNLPTKADQIVVALNGERKDKALITPGADGTSFKFTTPTEMELGKYCVSVFLKATGEEIQFTPSTEENDKLIVFGEHGKSQPTISAVYPLVTYPGDPTDPPDQRVAKDKKTYVLEVVGEGFGPRNTDNKLLINEKEIPVCWPDKPCDKKDVFANGTVVSNQQIQFALVVPKDYRAGATKVQVRVGNNISAPTAVTLSRVESKLPQYAAIAVVVVLFGLVLWLLSGGFRNVIAGRKYSILSALFLDAETETYSLSRLQFFIWTAVAILTYIYLLLSRSLVQGQLEFVDVPGGLPGIIGISAGTTVLAQMITKSKGPKGAGEIHPSLTDLVSTGGVIVPERFQFFVWTILGAAAFIFIVFLNDPGTIQDLPSVPGGFLQLMGLSSAGYLGGKIARRAGPVIDEIIASTGSLEFTLKGRNLSKDAIFRIGDKDIPSDQFEGGLKPQILEVDTEGEPNTGKMIKLKIKNPEPDWVKDNNQLTIINPDGQKATLNYTVGPFVVGPIQVGSQNGSDAVVLTIKAQNISDQSTVTLESTDGSSIPADEIGVEFTAPDTLVVTTLQRSGFVIITNPDQRSQRVAYPS